MTKFEDLTNKRFGKLIVIEYVGKSKWLCQCDCGQKTIVRTYNLKNNITKSCGCFVKENTSKMFTKHGNSRLRLYKIWCNMRSRCLSEKNKNFKNYGGRSITVCDEWKNDFKAFYNWAMNNCYQDNLTIDRADVNGNYDPSNCLWIPKEKQNRNQRTNHNITYYGETHCLTEWAEILGIKRSVLSSRINTYGWSIEQAFNVKAKDGKNEQL